MKFARGVCCVLFIVIIVAASVPRSIAGDRKPAENIAFNFIDVEIPTVIKFISEITGNNFIFDEKVKGKITIIAPAKLSIDESFSLFTSVLSLKGYTIIPTGPKTYKIIPSSQAKEEGKISTDENIPVNEAYITKLIPTQHIKAEDTIQFLRPVVSRDGYIAAFGPGNMLLVVDSASNIEKITSILKLIDQPSAQEEAKINVYFLENADATNLAKVLDGIVKNLQTAYRSQKANGGRPSDIPPFSIMPDKTTNSLIIIAPPQDYENIIQVVKTLDKRRKQVYVEAMIVEASIDKLRELGSKWRATATHNGEPIVVGGFGTVNTNTLLSIINGLTGFSTGGMGNFFEVPITSITSSGSISTDNLTAPGFAALFSLNDFRDAVNVLSTPQILTSDNEEAEIVVGENVPFISKRERDVTTTNTVLNSIERKDVGITLRLTPQITEGDYVKLDIYQEISALKETPESVFTEIGPTTTKRSTKTSVSVKDGRTVVIGGLMQEKEEENVNKMPLLGDIPVMGWLFKSKNLSKNKTNLLVFLSPHIVKESDQLSKITEEKHKDFSIREKLYSPGELMVKFREDIAKEKAMEIISRNGAVVIKYFDDINVFHIKLRPKQEVEDAINEFTSLPEVLYAEPNYKIKIDKNPPSPDKEEAPATPDPSSGNGQESGNRSAGNHAEDFDLALVVSDGSAGPSNKHQSIGNVTRPTEEQALTFPEKAPGSESVDAGSDSAETVLKPEQDHVAVNNSPPPDVQTDKAPAPPVDEVPAAQPVQVTDAGETVTASVGMTDREDKKKIADSDVSQNPPDPALIKAELLFRQERYREALRLYRELERSEGIDRESVYRHREQLITGLSPEKRKGLLSELSLAVQSREKGAAEDYILALILSGDYDEGVKAFSGGGIQYSDYLLSWIAWAYFKTGGTEKAKQFYQQILNERPQYTPAGIGLAYCLVREGQDEGAFAVLDGLMKREPRNTEVMFARGFGHERAGRFLNAVQEYDRILDMDPGNDTARKLKVMALSDMGTFSQSPEEKREAPAPGPNTPGKYYIQVGAWKDAKNARNVFEHLRTDYPSVYSVEEGNFTKIRIPGIMTKEQGLLVIRKLKDMFKFKLEPILRTQKI